MDLGALQEKAKHEIKRFEVQLKEKEYDDMLFLYTTKITEEIGNLAAAVLGQEGVKAEQPVTNDEVSTVFADAIYSIVILAQKMNVNLDRVLQKKITQIEQQGSSEEGF